MRKRRGFIGGFAGQNNGTITDCFSIVKVNSKMHLLGGFTGENIGDLKNCFYSGPTKRLAGGVSGTGQGKVEQCWFFHEEKEKNLDKLPDKQMGIHADEVKNAEERNKYITEQLGYNIENIWEYVGDERLLRFIPEKWIHEVAVKPDARITLIRTADDLISLGQRINGGDKALASSLIKLENDIDLGGKEWEPIGSELSRAFAGIFDGGGYTVRNFKIKSKHTKAKGFFGYLKGEVYNLTVDCIIIEKSNSPAGGIAAYCDEKAVIGYSAAIVDIKGKSGNIGGLVGSNNGKIFKSYSAGKISRFFIIWWWGLGLPAILFPLIFWLLLDPPGGIDNIQIFPPPPVDPGVERIPGEPINPVTGSNFVSFEFEREIVIDMATGEGRFHFINPGNSNHDIIVQLQMTDAEAVLAMGSTGRTSEEQARLDAHPDYDPELHRMILGESGLVPVGFRMDNLTLTDQPNGASLRPGRYPAIVFLLFYDRNTHARAMLESQLPVTIIVN